MPHLKVPSQIKKTTLLQIDNASKRNLEISTTLKGEKEGSLFHSVDYTFTPAGKRKLLNDLENPLYSVEKINHRLNLVEFFFQNYNLISRNLQEKLKKIPDIARSSNRLLLRRGGPRDMLSILLGLEQFEKLVIEIKRQADKSQLTNAFNSLVDDLSKNKSLLKIVDLLKKALKENIPLQNKEGDFIKKGFNFELDKIRSVRDNSKSIILEIENKEKQLTGINNLKIKYNNYITRNNLHTVKYKCNMVTEALQEVCELFK